MSERDRRKANVEVQASFSSDSEDEISDRERTVVDDFDVEVENAREMYRQVEMAERAAHADLLQQFQQLQIVVNELRMQQEQAEQGHAPVQASKAPYTGKPPIFDIDNDKATWRQWKEHWRFFQISSGLSSIADENAKAAAKRAALSTAMTTSVGPGVHAVDG